MNINDNKLTCTRCDAELSTDTVVWLILRTSTNTYHFPGPDILSWADTADDQGAFPFGVCCAEKEAKRTEEGK